MAFGFSPKHVEDVPFGSTGKERFLALALEAASQLNWNVSFVSKTGFIAFTKASLSSWSEEVTVKLFEESAQIKSECAGSQFFDWGKNKKNVYDLRSKIGALEQQMSQEEMQSKVAALQESYASEEEDILSQTPSTSKEKITDFFSILKPTEGYFVSPILIIINILVFAAMWISGVHVLFPENQDLLNWGANFRPMTLAGQWWRLFTSCFLHIGILHLLFNLYALIYIGLLLEPYLGKTRFLAAYVISGIAASLTSLWWHDLMISAGASGAIFGMYGVFIALLTTNLLDKSIRKALFTSIAVFVGYNILNGLKPDSGIDNAAHIGGLLSGLLIGYAFVPSIKNVEQKSMKFATIGALAVALFISSFTVYTTLPNDLPHYEKEMERFFSMESLALELYNLPEGTPDETILAEIKDRGLYYWGENLKLIESFDELDLPEQVVARNARLKTYCELRIKSYELIYKAIEENTDRYEDQLNMTVIQIENIINEFSGNPEQAQ